MDKFMEITKIIIETIGWILSIGFIFCGGFILIEAFKGKDK